MQSSALEALRDFAVDAGAGELTGALLVSRCVDESIDVRRTQDRFDTLAAGQDALIAPWDFLREQGFRGDSQIGAYDGSRMDVLIDFKRGLPITLGVTLLHMSQALGLEASGINFPGHFLVKVGDTLVDPFTMHPTDEAGWLATLPAEALGAEPFAIANSQAIVLRMFNNLKLYFAAQAQFHRSLDMVDCQLQLLPANSALNFERGELWLRLGSVDGARAAFEAVLAGPDREVAELARRALQRLSTKSDTIH